MPAEGGYYDIKTSPHPLAGGDLYAEWHLCRPYTIGSNMHKRNKNFM